MNEAWESIFRSVISNGDNCRIMLMGLRDAISDNKIFADSISGQQLDHLDDAIKEAIEILTE